MKYISKKAEQRFGQAFGNASFSEDKHEKEGEVSIDKIPNKEKKSNHTVGDYVDFEEIE